MKNSKIYNFKIQEKISLIELLAKETGLSKQVLKRYLKNGAVWLKKRGRKKFERVRRASLELFEETQVQFYYNPHLEKIESTPIELIYESRHWGVWYKPVNILSHGTKFADEGAVERQLQQLGKKDVYLVHRLERETAGLILVSYDKTLASKFSDIWASTKIEKKYLVEVRGDLVEGDKDKVIDAVLEGKKAETYFRVIEAREKTTLVEATLPTGKVQQLKSYFADLGHPIVGDRKFGRGKKDSQEIKLVAYKLKVTDPVTNRVFNFEVPEEKLKHI